ncbi:DMT family transporter [Microvirga tunisiensis]|uniref:EamA family transporter n=1 Tax=Microvirga tunisiensis TaxID=2108360 RepID=A0A5N7MNN8_9HYPH|nr:EamA family transporter [Microvirga tunisiensis]MPR09868.1 EamA family transporter [Microvirga tunisiensis]MPR28079.1 EamA family transporter [Microvirga tunisiensis]
MTTRTATTIGLIAILLWSMLALFTAATGTIPPFQLNAMTFLVGGLVGVVSWIVRPQGLRALRQKPIVWALGIGGLFGYHALYFAALRWAPPAESGLINYLWPLLIVLFSSLLPGEHLRRSHIAGALLGFAGVVVLIAGRGAFDARAEYMPGYICAFIAAFVWAGYSVLSRRFGQVPTDAVAGFCLMTSLLSLVCHLIFETTVWPETNVQWLALLALGLGPVGAAFYVWDIGMKRGDIRFLGVASYATPVLSTLLLVAAGYAEPTLTLALACGLIVAGALIATLTSKKTAPA